jgi:hypothetical protein
MTIKAVAMLIPTNDTFVALNRVGLPAIGTIAAPVPARDAGTGRNDGNRAHIPDPRCGGEGEGYSAGPDEGDEGFVHSGKGVHEPGSQDRDGNTGIDPKTRNWRNCVASITVRQLE